VAKSYITVCFTYSFRLAIFLNTYISQGSVATPLGCGGVFVYDFLTNFLLSLTVKEFWKSVNIWWSYGQELGVLFLFDSRCRISPPRFLAECCKRQLNQSSFVLLYFGLFTFSDLHWVCLSVFSCTVLFVGISQVIGCEDRLRNDLYCVEWGVKLYSSQPTNHVRMVMEFPSSTLSKSLDFKNFATARRSSQLLSTTLIDGRVLLTTLATVDAPCTLNGHVIQ